MKNLTPIQRAIKTVGSQREMARRLGVTVQAITRWKRKIPAERVLSVEAVTGGAVTRYELRPDLYPRSMMSADERKLYELTQILLSGRP